MARFRTHGRWLLALVALPAAFARLPQAQERTAEQQVWQVVLDRYGGGEVALEDSTTTEPCCTRDPPRGVPADAWTSFQERNRHRVALREHLPADLQVKWVSELRAPARQSCRFPHTLALTRVGFSADSTVAVIGITSGMGPGPYPGCGYLTGFTYLLHRTPEGGWRFGRAVGGFIT